MSMNRRAFVQRAGATAAALSLGRRAIAGIPLQEAWQRAADIVRNIQPPVIPEHVFDITKFGAVPDGRTLNTAAIASRSALAGAMPALSIASVFR